MLTFHRRLQLIALNDRAAGERVAFYCRAIKATQIRNRGAARHFTTRAQQWERIRIACQRRLLPYAPRNTYGRFPDH